MATNASPQTRTRDGFPWLRRRWVMPMTVVSIRVQTWWERSRQRRALAALNDALLKDIGLSRAEVEAETRKRFWKP